MQQHHYIPQARYSVVPHGYQVPKTYSPRIISHTYPSEPVQRLTYQQSESNLVRVGYPQNDEMLVSFGREAQNMFVNQQRNLQQRQRDQLKVKAYSPSNYNNETLDSIRTIVRDSRVKDDSSNEGDAKHHYRKPPIHAKHQSNIKTYVPKTQPDKSEKHERTKSEYVPVRPQPVQSPLKKSKHNESFDVTMNPEDDSPKPKSVINPEQRMSLSFQQQQFRQVFFVVYQEKWVKIEVDLKSYPKSWSVLELSKTLSQLYAEEENLTINFDELNIVLKFFRYNSKSGQEDVNDLRTSDTLQKLRGLVDFNFNLDYFWLKLLPKD